MKEFSVSDLEFSPSVRYYQSREGTVIKCHIGYLDVDTLMNVHGRSAVERDEVNIVATRIDLQVTES